MVDLYETILGQVRIFMNIFFFSMKYILAFIFIILGVISLISMKMGEIMQKFSSYQDFKSSTSMKKFKIVSGYMLIVIGVGFLLNYLLWFFYLILPQDGLLGRFVIQIVKNADIADLNFKMIFIELFGYILGFLSLITIIGIVISIYMLLQPKKSDRTKHHLSLLISSLIIGILFGFSNCFSYLL